MSNELENERDYYNEANDNFEKKLATKFVLNPQLNLRNSTS